VADRLLLKYVFSASVSAVEFDVIKFDKVVLSVDIFVDVSVSVSWTPKPSKPLLQKVKPQLL
jgi:hypothetical protein